MPGWDVNVFNQYMIQTSFVMSVRVASFITFGTVFVTGFKNLGLLVNIVTRSKYILFKNTI